MGNGIKNIARRINHFFAKFRNLRRRNKAILITAILIAAVIIFGQISSNNSESDFQTEKVKMGDIVEVVSETGTITLGGYTSVYSPTNGIVTAIYVRNGDEVTSGQELMSIESTATEQEVASAYASYLAAKSALDQANASMYSLQSAMFSAWDVYKNYAEDHKSSEERATSEYHTREKDWLAAEASYKNQQGVVNQAQAALSSSYLLYNSTQSTVVKSASIGRIENLSVSVGGSVVAGSTTQIGTPLLHITTPGVDEVVIALGESDIALVEEGQSAVIDVKSLRGKEYLGIVSRVDSLGSSVGGVVKYLAYVTVKNGDESLRTGMTADVSIETEKLEGVLLVPNSAVKPYQGGRAVRIIDEDGEIEFVPVKVGLRGESSTQILEGVTEGTEVVTSLSNDQLDRGGLF